MGSARDVSSRRWVPRVRQSRVPVPVRQSRRWVRHCIVDATSPRYSRDFDGMCLSHPAVVVRPTSSVEVSKVIQLCDSSSYLTVSPRGNGHSVSGQAMPVNSTNIYTTMSLERWTEAKTTVDTKSDGGGCWYRKIAGNDTTRS
ncbi:UDP-N-acetylmuramate dehydrogenase [Zostera marina]|uniref:UDP-N-acetylmuramate dehydrogenase n=1 Tax=Zostera marina TaxID=29655 RepID=A0A0K9PH67_ZOSMR|nr:UDP-N-acetylmuramate dehydrogenase [Zostera marina]